MGIGTLPIKRVERCDHYKGYLVCFVDFDECLLCIRLGIFVRMPRVVLKNVIGQTSFF
jgi:hypothetical protein